MCEFQSLYFEDDGYVVRCNHCSHYQVGFSSIMLTLADKAFQQFRRELKHKCTETAREAPAHGKVVMLKTPSPGVCMMLTRSEAVRFAEILEQADSEMRALGLMRLFNPG